MVQGAEVKQKTYLSPERQWEKTLEMYVRHARSWSTPAAFEKAMHVSEWFSDARFPPVRRSTDPDFGIVRRPHKVLCVGDVVFFRFLTGAMRHGVFCKTRKGRTVGGRLSHSGMYVDEYWDKSWEWSPGESLARTIGVVQRIEWPGHLVGKRLDDPGIRSFVVETARAQPQREPARPVGVSADNPPRLP